MQNCASYKFAGRGCRCKEARGEAARRTKVRRSRIDEALTPQMPARSTDAMNAKLRKLQIRREGLQMQGSARRGGEAYESPPQPNRRTADAADGGPVHRCDECKTAQVTNSPGGAADARKREERRRGVRKSAAAESTNR